jgi:hypothetical protein
MNISKAKQVYKESKDSRNLLLSIFTKEELGVRTIPSKEEFNKFFEGEILSQVDPSKTRFPTKNSFSCIQLCNSKGEWLFDYDYNPKDPHFWYQYNRVNCVLQDKFSLQDDEILAFMKSLVESHFNLKDTQPRNVDIATVVRQSHTSI